MAIRRFLPALLLQAVLFSGTLLYAQEPAGSQDAAAKEGDYFLEQRFVQRLSWRHHDLVFRYEVILEEEQNEKYEEIQRESTHENSLNLSLRPGRYRYAVQVYNLYRQLEYTMDWVYFTVFSALKPEILTFSPEAFFLDTESRWQITISGRDIDPEALVLLRSRGVSVEKTVDIHPLSMALEKNTVRLTFDKAQLAPGAYNLYVRNPGGLEDALGIFRVQLHAPAPGESPSQAPSRRLGILVSAGYAPLIPLYGGLFNDTAFSRPIFPLGIAIRVGVLPLKRDWGSLGAELNASWNRLKEQKENYTIMAQNLEAHLNILYQVWLSNRIMAFNFRLGAGINVVRDFYFDYGDGAADPLTGIYLSLNAGLSFQWYIKGPFFIETGMDFTHILSLNDQSQPGYLKPSVGVGWRF
jgi:hypothetical protein